MPTSVLEAVPPAPIVRGHIVNLLKELKLARRLLRVATAADDEREDRKKRHSTPVGLDTITAHLPTQQAKDVPCVA